MGCQKSYSAFFALFVWLQKERERCSSVMTSGLVKVINHGRRESSLGVFVLRIVVYFFPALGYTSGRRMINGEVSLL